jgi:hypothetical protein
MNLNTPRIIKNPTDLFISSNNIHEYYNTAQHTIWPIFHVLSDIRQQVLNSKMLANRHVGENVARVHAT